MESSRLRREEPCREGRYRETNLADKIPVNDYRTLLLDQEHTTRPLGLNPDAALKYAGLASVLRSQSSRSYTNMAMIPNHIRKAFDQKFGPIAEKFKPLVLGPAEWRDRNLVDAARPGVYVWYTYDAVGVWKVGMSGVNARHRALQHLRDNTGGRMAELSDRADARMILFTLESPDNNLARELELYLESELSPEIKSLR